MGADGRNVMQFAQCHAIRAVLLTLESSGADSSVLTEDAWKIQAAMRVRPFGMAGGCDGGLVPFVAVALAGWLWSCLWLLLASCPVQQLYQPEVDQRLACAYEGGTAEAI